MAADIRQQINQMSIRHFFLVSALLASGYYFLLFEGAARYANQMKQLRTQIAALNTDIAANKKVIEDTERFRGEVNQISDQFQAALEYLPSKTRIQDILSMLYSEARVTGVKLTKLRPLEPKQDKFYEELQMEISVNGTYSQITDFLGKVAKIPRIINIKEVRLDLSSEKSTTEGILLSLNGRLITYRYLEGK